MRPLLCVAAVLLAQAASAEKILIGQLSTLAHSVSGEVYALDEKTLMIKDFNYDGAGDNALTVEPLGCDRTPSNCLQTEKAH